MAIEYRRAKLEDADRIARYAADMALETENLRLDRERVRRGAEAVLRDASKGFYVLAEAENQVVGQSLITFEWSDWSNGLRWWVQSVYVHPDFRRQGIYRGLFAYVQELARADASVCCFRLYVHRANGGAQAVYRRLGFVETEYLLYEMDFPVNT